MYGSDGEMGMQLIVLIAFREYIAHAFQVATIRPDLSSWRYQKTVISRRCGR